MAPQSMSVAEVSRQTGVTTQTLYNWRKRARGEGVAMVADAKNPEAWTGKSKPVVVETAALNED
jgi:transposase-like protein